MRYIVGIADGDVEMTAQNLHRILLGSKIHSVFQKETFIKLETGVLIRVFNQDLERLKSEIRDNLIDLLLH